jgi:hypothetical protein
VSRLNFTYFNDFISSTLSTGDRNKRAIIADDKGTEIANSSSDNKNMESLISPKAFKMQEMANQGY